MELGVSKELYNIMDALAALKLDLECEPRWRARSSSARSHLGSASLGRSPAA